jgi:hypothetical protein
MRLAISLGESSEQAKNSITSIKLEKNRNLIFLSKSSAVDEGSSLVLPFASNLSEDQLDNGERGA